MNNLIYIKWGYIIVRLDCSNIYHSISLLSYKSHVGIHTLENIVYSLETIFRKYFFYFGKFSKWLPVYFGETEAFLPKIGY